MMLTDMKEKVNAIDMSADMRARIVKNCYLEMENASMREDKKMTRFRKPAIAIATLALCICVTGISVIAASGKLQGFFKDIKSWNGAVVGTSYEQATEELQIRIIDTAESLMVEVTFLTPEKAPYLYFEQLGIHEAAIVDLDGNVIVKGISSELAHVKDGNVIVQIPLENVPVGNYKLQISELVGSKKADQPIVLFGEWECEFAW